MTTVRMTQDGGRNVVQPIRSGSAVRPVLLACGVLSSLLYVAMLAFVPMRWEGYSSAAQAVSELSAIGAPTRPLWVLLGVAYTLLVTAFGWGVLMAAGHRHHLRVVGSALVAYGLLGLFWPPMHLRGVESTLTDTMHIAFAIATLLLMLLAIGFGAASLGKSFRRYSIATIWVFAVFGTLTFLNAPRLAANLPTPWLGIWERINIGAFLLWVIVLAVALLSPRPMRERSGALAAVSRE